MSERHSHRVEHSQHILDAALHSIALGVQRRIRAAMPDQVQGDHAKVWCKTGGVPRPCGGTAGEAMQEQQRWTGAGLFNMQRYVINMESHHTSPAMTGAIACETTFQISRCSVTLRFRSVGTSTICSPPASSPRWIAARKACQVATRSYAASYIWASG